MDFSSCHTKFSSWLVIAFVFSIFQVDVSQGLSIVTTRLTKGTNRLTSVARHVPRVDRLKMMDTEAEVTPIPTYLPSDRGVDYVPLATMLATGDYKGADQFTRDNLIKIAGLGAVKRAFVYWTEVPSLPETDLCTMERLWLEYSKGTFGYSVQKRVWDVENGNFDSFIRRIGWTKVENGSERKLKWFGQSEFIYTLEGAPKGHLPLTSALRGTQLMKKLMEHPVWTKVCDFLSCRLAWFFASNIPPRLLLPFASHHVASF